jgi:hypothetical protein
MNSDGSAEPIYQKVNETFPDAIVEVFDFRGE